MKKIDLSIVILDWNNFNYLKNCLRTLFNNTKGIIFEVIIIDNGSSDKFEVQSLKKIYPSLIIKRNKENKGFGQGNQQGIELSRGRYVLTLNNDTEIQNNLFKKMVDFMDENKKVGAMAVLSYSDRQKKIPNNEGYKKQMKPWTYFLNEVINPPLSKLFPNSKFFRNLLSMSAISPYDSCEVEHLNGSCMIYRKIAFDEVGGFDPKFFLFCSETDWCLRAKKKGWKLYYLATSYIIHFGGKSFPKVSERARLFDNDYKIFIKKNYSFFSVVSYKILRLIMVPFNALYYYIGRKIKN